MDTRIILDAQGHEVVAIEHRIVVDRHDVVAVQLFLAVVVSRVVAASKPLVGVVVQQCDIIGVGVLGLQPFIAAIRRVVVDNDDMVIAAGAVLTNRRDALRRGVVDQIMQYDETESWRIHGHSLLVTHGASSYRMPLRHAAPDCASSCI